jgi:hypothetical protein
MSLLASPRLLPSVAKVIGKYGLEAKIIERQSLAFAWRENGRRRAQAEPRHHIVRILPATVRRQRQPKWPTEEILIISAN